MNELFSFRPEDLRVVGISSRMGFGNSASSGVEIIHLPTGISVSATSERTQYQNKAKAMRELEDKVQQNKGRYLVTDGQEFLTRLWLGDSFSSLDGKEYYCLDSVCKEALEKGNGIKRYIDSFRGVALKILD